MPENSKEDSIKESLNIIRKALNQDHSKDIDDNEEILFLDQLVKDDGTIKLIEDNKLSENEIKKTLDDKLNEVFDTHLEKWLNKNIPDHLDKYFSKKEK